MYCQKCGLSELKKDKDSRITFDKDNDVVVIQHYVCPECGTSYILTTYNKRYKESWTELSTNA